MLPFHRRISQSPDISKSTAPNTGEVLTWNNSTKKWTPANGLNLASVVAGGALFGGLSLEGGLAMYDAAYGGTLSSVSMSGDYLYVSDYFVTSQSRIFLQAHSVNSGLPILWVGNIDYGNGFEIKGYDAAFDGQVSYLRIEHYL